MVARKAGTVARRIEARAEIAALRRRIEARAEIAVARARIGVSQWGDQNSVGVLRREPK